MGVEDTPESGSTGTSAVASLSNLPTTPYRITTEFKAPKLAKSKGNYREWFEELNIYLRINNLSRFMNDDPAKPPASNIADSLRWKEGDGLTTATIYHSMEQEERDELSFDKSARENLATLKARHQQQGVARQISYLQEAFGARFDGETPLDRTAKKIRESVKNAFACADLSEDLLTCICILNALSDEKVTFIRSNIANRLASSTKADPYDYVAVLCYLENEQSVRDNLGKNGSGPDAIALAASANRSRFNNRPRPNQDRPFCVNCKGHGHAAEFCIREGGGMAGKTRAEASEARKNATAKKSGSPHQNSASSKAFTFQSPDGKTFVAYQMETSSPSDNAAATMFTLDTDSQDEIDAYEYANIAMDIKGTEARVSVNWNTHSRDSTPSALNAQSSTAPTSIPLSECPFYLDTGATVHVSPDYADFTNVRSIPSRPIKGVGGSSIAAVGMGDIIIHSGEATLTLKDALYVPDATVRLISVGSVARDSKTGLYFDDRECSLVDPTTFSRKVIGDLLPTKRLYALRASGVDHAFAMQHAPDLVTLHNRMGHANYRVIQDMARNGMIAGVSPKLASQLPAKCISCIQGKQTRTPVPKVREEGPDHKATRKLEKVFVDLTGPFVQSRSKNLYVLDIIDDYTDMPWSIPVKSKDQALKVLMAWQLLRENETGLKVFKYNIDNGELKSTEFDDWCKARGIVARWTSANTSAQNGRVERLHKTLLGKARTMRIHSKCPPNTWDEFWNTAAHLHQKTVSCGIKTSTPWERWYDRKPDYSYMREIGCKAFVLILSKHNPKVYERSIECTLIGYEPNSKSYRCYHHASGKVISSYHVRFLESHDGHPLIPPSIDPAPTSENGTQITSEPTTLQEIRDSSTIFPLPNTVTLDDDLDPYSNSILPHSNAPVDPPTPQARPDVHTPLVIQPEPQAPPIPVQETRRRSTRTQAPKEDPVQRAVRESRASATRVHQARENNQPAFWNIRNPAPAIDSDSEEELEVADALQATALPGVFPVVDIDPAAGPEDPRNLREAQNSPYWPQWEAAFQEEIDAMKSLQVWKLVPRSEVPSTTRVRKSRPVFTVKRNEAGEATKFKVRLVFRGDEQIPGVDFNKTHSPTARPESWKIVLHMAAANGWDAQQIDVKTAFLNGILPEDEIQYMEQPKGFEEPGKED